MNICNRFKLPSLVIKPRYLIAGARHVEPGPARENPGFEAQNWKGSSARTHPFAQGDDRVPITPGIEWEGNCHPDLMPYPTGVEKTARPGGSGNIKTCDYYLC